MFGPIVNSKYYLRVFTKSYIDSVLYIEVFSHILILIASLRILLFHIFPTCWSQAKDIILP